MSDTDKDVIERIIEARVGLLLRHPFFGTMAIRLKVVNASSWCRTMSTDGKNLFFNEEYVRKIPKDELQFMIGHQILHGIFDHLGRKGDKITEHWDAATDLITNYTLVKNGIGKMPEGGLYNEKFTDEMSSEEVYLELTKQFPPMPAMCDTPSKNEKKDGKKGEELKNQKGDQKGDQQSEDPQEGNQESQESDQGEGSDREGETGDQAGDSESQGDQESENEGQGQSGQKGNGKGEGQKESDQEGSGEKESDKKGEGKESKEKGKSDSNKNQENSGEIDRDKERRAKRTGKGRGNGQGQGQTENNQLQCGGMKPLDDHLNLDPEEKPQNNENLEDGPPAYTEEELAGIRNEILATMIGASQSANDTPAGILRLIDEQIRPTLDWKEILRARIQSHYKEDYTFMRMSKKSWSLDVILPANNISTKLKVGVAIDASGSIGNKELGIFLNEIKGIVEDFNSFELMIWSFDVKVNPDSYQIFTNDNISDLMDYKVYGKGGTHFNVNWKFMEEQDLLGHNGIDILVFFTDGRPNDGWGDPDAVDTVFLIYNQKMKDIVAPHGQTIYLDD